MYHYGAGTNAGHVRDNNRLNTTGILAASFLLFFAVMSMTPDQQSPGIADNFVGAEYAPVTPVERDLPDLTWGDTSPLLQVGLFRHLMGAETKQSELTSIGLTSDIVKRPTADGMMYAVMISPKDEREHRATLATLQANKLSYFHARRHGT